VVILFFIELIVLFFLSRQLTSELSLLFYKIFKSQKVAIFLMAIIFLPGTVIHEFSHAIMAKALFVYVGKMSLFPQLNGNSLKLGSVEVGKTDIIRNFLIGIAPFIVGTTLLLFALFYFFTNHLFGFNLLTVLALVFTFMMANTMYSSKKDMEGAIEFILLIVAPIITLYIAGVRVPGLTLEILNGQNLQDFFKTACILLGIPLILDLAIIVFGKIVNKVDY